MGNIVALREDKARLYQGGGKKRIEAQHEKGKLTARERLGLLFDWGTFVEMDTFVQHRCTDFGMEKNRTPGDGVVTGYGKVNGRLVYAFAQDFTVLGGSLGEYHAEKIVKAQDRALQNGAPIVGLLDSGGARIQEGVGALNGYGKIFYRNTISSGVIPQISAIMGPCAGGAVYSPAITDFIFMVEGTSNMFITGPQVIKTVTGEEITAEDLGGARVHNTRSGVSHFMMQTDEECIARIRDLLAYLPQNNRESAPKTDCDDFREIVSELDLFVPESPSQTYDMNAVIRSIVDNGEMMEVQPDFAKNIITGFARIAGQSVGIVANQPRIMAGCLDVNASDKAARFVRLCDSFNIPLVTFVDVPGFLPGSEQEYAGIIRHGAKLLFSYSEATVPKMTVVLRKAYGGAYIAMCCQALGADATFAWPTAEIAVMGAEGAANIVFKSEIAKADDPAAKRAEKIDDYREAFNSPYPAAQLGYIDDIIEPCETRVRLIDALSACAGKVKENPKKKHGNMPL